MDPEMDDGEFALFADIWRSQRSGRPITIHLDQIDQVHVANTVPIMLRWWLLCA